MVECMSQNSIIIPPKSLCADTQDLSNQLGKHSKSTQHTLYGFGKVNGSKTGILYYSSQKPHSKPIARYQIWKTARSSPQSNLPLYTNTNRI